MSSFEPGQSAARQRSKREGLLAIVIIMALMVLIMVGMIGWTFGVERPAQAAQATQSAEQTRAVMLAASDLGELELVLDDTYWQLPKYREMLFLR